ncbi:uncharacterized protein GGS22DRAFT_99642 [Annulohypoxylon maeteangense]|uniref:uncharacterized protein n=1 Tax=Annulohypoxylon maeteangense TaxID=1927788 RepID=UPI002007AEA7|nr:uncharacterized protein GGS22DRAFT_99642 [Annulohypoxylon maeteangense]KAI0880088.1 hypothetical protein GGS22DRAFT_99642 [Annulohypoxylon maeteangense]
MDLPKLTPSKSKARDPPRLFLHPSPAASHVSLSGMMAAAPAAPPASASASNVRENASAASTTQSQVPPSLARTNSLLNARTRATVSRLHTADSTRTADRTDALWAEMQATLEEVELSASGGTHVFGPEHDRKLAELRAAQIGLAQAWARGETDDTIEITATTTKNDATNLKGALAEMGISAAAGAGLSTTISASAGRTAAAAAEGTEGGKSTAGTGSVQRPGSSGTGRERLGTKLEEETEKDILLARNRREANDRYFSKIDQGVRDVVEKLEEVAIAMKAVEEETRNIWGDSAMPDNLRV